MNSSAIEESWRSTGFGDRRGRVLFIDARKFGRRVDRVHNELSTEEIAKIAKTYHAWRGEKEAGEYADVAGFCKSVTLKEVESHGFVLTPGRYVGTADDAEADDGEPFDQKIARLTKTLEEQFAELDTLGARIRESMRDLGLE